MIRAAAEPIPRYGSEEFLTTTDPVVVAAATVVFAECWAEQSDDVAGRLRRELDDARAAHDALDAEAFADVAWKVRHLASVPTIAELFDRRGMPDRAARARARAIRIRDGWNGSPGDAA